MTVGPLGTAAADGLTSPSLHD